MTNEEKQKAINALKISAPVKAVTQEEFNDYIQTLNRVMDWLEQEPFMNKPCVAHQICREDKNKVLDKIRAEIKHLHNHPKLDFIKNDEIVDMVLEIIDKCKVESEGDK